MNDVLAKHYFKSAFECIIEKKYTMAYVYIKEGYEYSICECPNTPLDRFDFDDICSQFDDFAQVMCENYEYYFAKSFACSFSKSIKYLYIGIESIDKYLKIFPEDNLGIYIKARLLGLSGDEKSAIGYFESLQLNYPSEDQNIFWARLSYKIGKFKDRNKNDEGIVDLYNALMNAPMSICCLNALYISFHRILTSDPESLLHKVLESNSLGGLSKAFISNISIYDKSFYKNLTNYYASSFGDQPKDEETKMKSVRKNVKNKYTSVFNDRKPIWDFMRFLIDNEFYFTKNTWWDRRKKELIEEWGENYEENIRLEMKYGHLIGKHDDYDDDYDRDTFNAYSDGDTDYDDFNEYDGDMDSYLTSIGRD
jgi:hypothetical protein